MADTKTQGELGEVIELMWNAGAHFGYSKSRRHPSSLPYIYGLKDKIEIFDLEKTSKLLEDAKKFVEAMAQEGKQLLFVGSKNEARRIVSNAAEAVGQPYVASRWIGGTLTNFPEVRKRIKRLLDITSQKEKGELSKYTKKEQLLIDREIEDLDRRFGGIVSLEQLPGAIFVVDIKKEKIAVEEARRKKIPIIGLANSDCNLKVVTYPVPGNDTAQASILFFVEQIAQAYRDGAKKAVPRSTEKAVKETKKVLKKVPSKRA